MLSGALQRIKKNERGAFDVDDLPSAAARGGHRVSGGHGVHQRVVDEQDSVSCPRSACAL